MTEQPNKSIDRIIAGVAIAVLVAIAAGRLAGLL